MAAASVLKLKVEDKEYNASLRQAQQGMLHLEQALQAAGKTFSQVDKSVVEYARGIGRMETQSKTARGRIGEMTSAFIELSRQYNNMSADVQKSDVGKAMAQSMEQLRQRTIAAKQELEDLNRQLTNTKAPDLGAASGGFLSGIGGKMSGALQVFAGNMLTQAAGAVANLGAEMSGMVRQGVELARQGEGIRIAFERLGRGDLLDGLRQATHGTVTDLELMKAAVKFDDFKLPLDELGTMLAFAQQKAKDTGQSVNYMVDSIVTGLGRKSLMILDNLGLSATEVKERMAETGDMTKAVGDIIREQMANAGDYVETAADRAAQANVRMQNKMEELGRKFAPLSEASNNLWTSMKIGILDVVGGPLAQLLNGLTEAGRLQNELNRMGGGAGGALPARLDNEMRLYRMARKSGNEKDIYRQTVATYDDDISWRRQYAKDIRAWQSGQRNMYLQERIQLGQRRSGTDILDAAAVERQVKALETLRKRYEDSVASLNAPAEIAAPITTTNTPTATHRAATKVEVDVTESLTELQLLEDELKTVENSMKPFGKTSDEWKEMNTYAEGLRQRIRDINGETPQLVEGLNINSNSGLSQYIGMLKEQLKNADLGSELYTSLSAQLSDTTALQSLVGESLKAGLGTALFDVADETGADFWTRAMEGGVDNIDWQAIVDKINEARKAAGLDAIRLDFETGTVGEQKTDKRKNPYLHTNEDGKQEVKLTEIAGGMADGIQSMTSSLQQLGIELPKGLTDVVSGIQSLNSIASAIITILNVIEAISSADAIIPFAGGGIVPRFANGGLIGKAAMGMTIPGHSYSGDLLRMPVDGGRGMIGVNSGEVILNQAQAGVLASELSGGKMRDISIRGEIQGEKIVLAVNSFLKRTGQGELVTW